MRRQLPRPWSLPLLEGMIAQPLSIRLSPILSRIRVPSGALTRMLDFATVLGKYNPNACFATFRDIELTSGAGLTSGAVCGRGENLRRDRCERLLRNRRLDAVRTSVRID